MKTLLPSFFSLLLCFGILSCSNQDEGSDTPVLETNASPTIQNQQFAVPENMDTETEIGVIIATDADEDTLTYSIVSDESNLFEITADGVLSLSSESHLDFESDTSHTLVIAVSDGEHTKSATITITVTDINENETPVIEAQTFEVAENIDSETLIGEILASDPNNDGLTFNIVSNDNGLFGISEDGILYIATDKKLDFETETTHNITVMVFDGEYTAQAMITINVTDIEETPIIEAQVFEIEENISADIAIGEVIATDPNQDALSFSITTNPDAIFTISENGVLHLNEGKNLDFETATEHTLTVLVSDGEYTAEAEITIKVTDIDENTAPVIENQVFEVSENINNSFIIGQLSANDAEDDPLSFTIMEDESNLFSINEAGELRLQDNAALDFETSETHQITIEVSDGIESNTATITITVKDVFEAVPFISVWEAEIVSLPLYASTENTQTEYNFIVDWGDGTSGEVTSWDDPDATHVYPSFGGIYTVTITGMLKGFNFSKGGSRNGFRDVLQWGTVLLGNDAQAFSSLEAQTTFSATDAPDLSQTTTMESWFDYSYGFYADINHWDVSTIKNMRRTFVFTGIGPLDQWDVSNVTDMSEMFWGTSFNQPIGDWDVSNVTTMRLMFATINDCYGGSFNQDISKWDVSNVKDMRWMFSGSCEWNGNHAFNQDISDWDVSNVIYMSGMFASSKFNQDISNWDVSNVETMYLMFNDSDFNQNINNWNVSNVTDMFGMFAGSKFNQDISSWDVSNVTGMAYMFGPGGTYLDRFAVFDQDISNWDTSNVTWCESFTEGSPLTADQIPKLGPCFENYDPSWYSSKNYIPSAKRIPLWKKAYELIISGQ